MTNTFSLLIGPWVTIPTRGFVSSMTQLQFPSFLDADITWTRRKNTHRVLQKLAVIIPARSY